VKGATFAGGFSFELWGTGETIATLAGHSLAMRKSFLSPPQKLLLDSEQCSFQASVARFTHLNMEAASVAMFQPCIVTRAIVFAMLEAIFGGKDQLFDFRCH
jgi:hypothetical protein